MGSRRHPNRWSRAPHRDPALESILAEQREYEAEPPSYEVLVEFQCRKWAVIDAHFRAYPFRVPASLPRAEQWRRVLRHLTATVDEREVVDWVAVQVDIAEHLAAGIQDLRPRKNGPCYELLLEFVSMRLHKADVVCRWMRAARATEGGAGFREQRL